MPRNSNPLTQREIRAEILVDLAELYRDPVSRSQYKRFAFRNAEQAAADAVFRELAAHLIIDVKLPNVVRLTDLGYQLIEPELDSLRRQRTAKPSGAAPRGFGVAPSDALVDDISRAIGGADFVMATRLVEGRFVVDWANAGFELVTGYTVHEIEAAGGWPTVLVDMPEDRLKNRLHDIIGGSKLAAEISIRTKAGRILRLKHESWPLVDAGGTRVVGTITACRRVRPTD